MKLAGGGTGMFMVMIELRGEDRRRDIKKVGSSERTGKRGEMTLPPNVCRETGKLA
jgi:hypothetical protein